MSELRECDCGAVEDVCIFVVDAGGQMVTAQARCCACGRRGPRVVCGLEVDARSSAIAGWNERPVEDALRTENERLVARIEELEAALNHAINAVLVHALDAVLEVNNG